jgi:hypothetical protein
MLGRVVRRILLALVALTPLGISSCKQPPPLPAGLAVSDEWPACIYDSTTREIYAPSASHHAGHEVKKYGASGQVVFDTAKGYSGDPTVYFVIRPDGDSFGAIEYGSREHWRAALRDLGITEVDL